MKQILTLFKKEFKSLFFSPLFYLIAFLTASLLGVTFSISILNFANQISNAMMAMSLGSTQQQNIHYVVFLPHLSLLNLILMFMVPALAMRLISEEKKNRTFDLLLTSPISSVQIVVGKYLSLLAVVLGLSLLAFSYIVVAHRMFDFTWAPVLLALTGIFLVGAVYSALSMFASSLTENTMIAFFVGIVFNISVWITGGFSELADSTTMKGIFDQISLNQHLQSMVEGVLRLNGVVFFVSVIFLFCFLTERVIESARWRS